MTPEIAAWDGGVLLALVGTWAAAVDLGKALVADGYRQDGVWYYVRMSRTDLGRLVTVRIAYDVRTIVGRQYDAVHVAPFVDGRLVAEARIRVRA